MNPQFFTSQITRIAHVIQSHCHCLTRPTYIGRVYVTQTQTLCAPSKLLIIQLCELARCHIDVESAHRLSTGRTHALVPTSAILTADSYLHGRMLRASQPSPIEGCKLTARDRLQRRGSIRKRLLHLLIQLIVLFLFLCLVLYLCRGLRPSGKTFCASSFNDSSPLILLVLDSKGMLPRHATPP